MRATIFAAAAFAAAMAMSATTAAAATVVSLGGGVGGGPFSASPPPASVAAGDQLIMTGAIVAATSPTSTFVITALDNLKFVEFEISTSGSIANMNLTSIDLDNGLGSTTFQTVDLGAGFGFGGANYQPFRMRAGDTVTLTFTDTSFSAGPPPSSGMFGGLGLTLFGDTEAAIVPVPAALPLLLTALGGMALLRSRRKAVA